MDGGPTTTNMLPAVLPSLPVQHDLSSGPRHERQQRLDAAIAAFRSEASASGYVVEEVRLRLPIPDIDVQPRVIIAQSAAAAVVAAAAVADGISGGGALPLPSSKFHRGLSPLTSSELPPVSSSYMPKQAPTSVTSLPGGTSGFKRTASGSVVLNALAPPLRDVPRGQFWTTVIADKRRGTEPPRLSLLSPRGASSPRPSSTPPTAIPDAHVQLLLHSAVSAQTPGSRARRLDATAPTRRSTGRSSTGRRREGRSAPRPFKCVQCPSSFDREGHLRVHVLAVHEKQRPFVCQVCEAAFGHSSSLLRHVRTVHQAGPEAPRHFRCSACPVSFTRVAQLNRHVAAAHPSLGTTSQQCKRSNRGFPNGEEVSTHVRAAHAEGC